MGKDAHATAGWEAGATFACGWEKPALLWRAAGKPALLSRAAGRSRRYFGVGLEMARELLDVFFENCNLFP